MIRVYEIPDKIPSVGFLFGGGKPIEFLMVDWFGEPSDFEGGEHMGRADLEKFLRRKPYRKSDRRYLVIADNRPDLTFVLEPVQDPVSEDRADG